MEMHIQMKYKRHTMCIQFDSWKEIICHMLGKNFGSKLAHPLGYIGQWFQTPHKETPVRKDHRKV